MKSEKACDRKSRSTDCPGPLPMILLDTIAILACATWASLSKSYSSGVISFLSRCFTIRFRQVTKRWNTPPPLITFVSVSPLLLTASTVCLEASWSAPMLPSVNTIVRNIATRMTTPPTSLPIWVIGTRPMNIMRNMTAKSSAAVDRFSMPISPAMGMRIHKIYLKAFLSAPSSRCMALRIWAVISTIVPFAISDGWKVMPPGSEITRLAPLMDSPPTSTHNKVRNEIMSKKGVVSLK